MLFRSIDPAYRLFPAVINSDKGIAAGQVRS